MDKKTEQQQKQAALIKSALEKIEKYLTPEEREALTYQPPRHNKV